LANARAEHALKMFRVVSGEKRLIARDLVSDPSAACHIPFIPSGSGESLLIVF
jgi:hypothetical protein